MSKTGKRLTEAAEEVAAMAHSDEPFDDPIEAIDSAERYFAHILEPQYREFFDGAGTLRHAFNLATDLFHFHEWLFEFHKDALEQHLGTTISSKADLWRYAESIDPKFGYVRDLANASKHVRLTIRPSTTAHHVANTSFQSGAFQRNAFSSGFQTSGVWIKARSGNVSFDECARSLFAFWKSIMDGIAAASRAGP